MWRSISLHYYYYYYYLLLPITLPILDLIASKQPERTKVKDIFAGTLNKYLLYNWSLNDQ